MLVEAKVKLVDLCCDKNLVVLGPLLSVEFEGAYLRMDLELA
jgi:hypothetical protein